MENLKDKSQEWWNELKPHIQQRLQTKYYPDDDFMATDSDIERIQLIYLKERLLIVSRKLTKKLAGKAKMDITRSFIIYASDDIANEYVEPKNGKDFKLPQLRKIVGGHIEIVETKFPDVILVLDEEGKLKQKERNKLATHMYRWGESDPIVGNVLICNQNQIK